VVIPGLGHNLTPKAGDLEEVHAFLVRLKHDAGGWKRTTARRIRDMRKSKGVTAEQIEARLRRHD